MTTIFHEPDADPRVLDGADVAVVGYGNQGRSWALNLRDSGLAVRVTARADESRALAESEGFAAGDIDEASTAEVICILVPDDVIPLLPIAPRADALVVVASGYCLAFDRIDLPCDVGMVAPRMLGPEVRSCYQEGVGFITGLGVHQDVTGTALARTLAVAHAIGGLRQGAIELTAMQEAVLDLSVEQLLAPALRHVSQSFVGVMLEQGIPLEAILTELFLSGEVERTYRLLRLEGYAAQMAHHSPTSQYGQLSRTGRYDHLDISATMRALADDIASGRFADEWDAERDRGHPALARLKAEALPPEIVEWEAELRTQLGERAEDAGMTDATATANRETVERFWAALYDRDWDRIASFFTAESSYTDMPTPPDDVAVGPDQILARLRLGIEPITDYEHGLILMVADGDVVVTEHTETWRWRTGEEVVLPFVSVHVLADGKITRWSDYWDLQTLLGGAPQWWIDHIMQGWQ